MLMFCTARGAKSERGEPSEAASGSASSTTYLDGGDVEGRGDAKDGHDDRLVLLVDEDLHLPDVLFSRHLRDVLVGHVGLPGSEARPHSKSFISHTSR